MTDNGMPRFLWCSNGRRKPVSYAKQSNVQLPRIKRAGYDVWSFHCTENQGSPVIDEDGIPSLFRKLHVYGNDVYAQHMEFSRALFSFGFYNGWLLCAEHGKYPHAHWEPVDSYPMRPDELHALRTWCSWTLAMSRWGQGVMEDAGLDPMYVPCGIDSAVFKPIDRAEARAQIQHSIDAHAPARKFDVTLGDKFVVFMIGENNLTPSRKGFPEGIAAFKAFHEKHPDSVLYLFTQLNKPDGVDLIEELRLHKLPEGSVTWVNQYFHSQGMISDEWLNDLYNAADVLLYPSHAEGFGLPLVEAQMAGCPAIITDCSSMTELLFSGSMVPGQRYPARKGWHWTMPNHDALVAALEDAYEKREDEARREKAHAGAMEYDADLVFEKYMLPALARITQEAKDGPEARMLRRYQTTKQVDIDGVKLAVRPGWDEAIATTVQSEYFPDIIDYTQVKRAVDVGAHIGAWSLWVKRQSPAARIVAIEAMPENAELLRQNVNGQHDSITVLEGMCAYTPGEYDMLIDPGNSGGQTLIKRGEPNPRVGGYTVRRAYEGKQYNLRLPHAIVADDTYETPQRSDILKLDCEGGEFDILNNAPIADLTAFHWIVGEYHTEMGDFHATLRCLDQWFTVRAIRPIGENGLFGLFCLERKDHVTQEG